MAHKQKNRRPAYPEAPPAQSLVRRAGRPSGRAQVVINNRPIKAEKEKKPGLHERYFWIFAFGVILISIFTNVFDFSLMPPSPASAGARWGGLFITRPYYGLHAWHFTCQTWAARSHVNYGLGYTKGYRTRAVGDPPPANPQRYVSHPPLEPLIMAFGMSLLGSQEMEYRGQNTEVRSRIDSSAVLVMTL